MVKTWPSHAGGEGLIPAQGVRAPPCLMAEKPKHKKQRRYCKKFNEEFKKMVYIKNRNLKNSEESWILHRF